MRSKAHISVLAAATLIFVWIGASWIITRNYYISRISEQVQQSTKLSQIQADNLASNIQTQLNFLQGVPGFFTHAVRVTKAVSHNWEVVAPGKLTYELRKQIWSKNPELNDLDKTLGIASLNFHADLLFVINTDGDAIASSNWDSPESLVGTNYLDRSYYQAARNGRRGQQYAVGRKTHTPGLFMSSPIILNGKFMGVVVAKTNVPDLRFLVNQVDSFVADSNGVIILSHDKNNEMFSLSGAPVNDMSDSDKQAMYLRNNFPEFQIKAWRDEDFGSLLRVEGEENPDVMASKKIPEFGLTIYVKNKLPSFFELKKDQRLFFILFSAIGVLLGMSALGLFTYVRSINIARKSLLKSDLRFKTLESATFEGIVITSEGRIQDANIQLSKILGYKQQELKGLLVQDLIPPEDLERVMENIDNGVESTIEHEILKKNGTRISVESHGQTIFQDGVPLRLTAIRDITERKRINDELRIAATAFESHEGMAITDADSIILQVNSAFADITGYSSEEVVGKTPRILSSGRHDQAFYDAMWQSINNSGKWEGEIWNRRKSGEIYPEHLTITAVKNSQGKVTNYVSTLSDITFAKAAENEIKHLAFYDPLTHLPNRRLLLDRLHHVFASSARNGSMCALLLIDLDNFKNLNDTLGHDIGDLLLQQVSKRLESCVRDEDTVARLGGDEFVVMLECLSGSILEAGEQTKTIGNKILSSLNQSYKLSKHDYHNTPSIGVTLFKGQEYGTDILFKQADIAMYQAKKSGRNTICFFDPKMQEIINARSVIESELRKAVSNREFQLFYQLQVEGKHPHLAFGAEALIRWIHPERGLISPDDFIPVAEETGQILSIGLWVLETACTQLADWSNRPGFENLIIAVNISASQLQQANFPDQVLEVIKRTGANPYRLKLELTESILQTDIESVISKMNILKAQGVGFSLDDFGTGYSSLSYLNQLPLDQLKIDRSFVMNLESGDGSDSICGATISMAHNLKLKVIAEGIETETQSYILVSGHSCDYLQGYFFGRPIPVDQFEVLVEREFTNQEINEGALDFNI